MKRKEAEQEAARCREALTREQEMTAALREHNSSLMAEKEALHGDVERVRASATTHPALLACSAFA